MKGLISPQMLAFGQEDDLEPIADKFNEIGNINAISKADILRGTELFKATFPLPDSDYTNELIDLRRPQEITKAISVKYEKLKEDTIMSSVQKIVDGYFGEEITIDANQVIEAFSKYKKKKIIDRTIEFDNRCRIRKIECPICGNHQLFKYQKFCGDCGQHLDWSEWDER